MDIKINYSHTRFRTVSARLVGGDLRVNAPAGIDSGQLEKIVEKLKLRFERRQIKQELSKQRPLSEIAEMLNKAYFEGKIKINSIEYSVNQSSKFGCCNSQNASILISHRLSEMPEWVRNYVIIHEMAHILEPNHGPNFWKLVYRYELTERAKGYLMAVGLESEKLG